MYILKKAFIASVLLLGSALANANLLDNGDFESNVGLSGKGWKVFKAIPGWQTYSGAGIEVERNTVVKAQSGRQYVELDSHNNSTMFQSLSNLTVGNSYDLSFWYLARTNRGGNDNGIDVLWGEGTPGTVHYSLNDLKRSDFSNGWEEHSLSLIATSTSMVLSFAATGISNSFGGFIDNISLVEATAVPEPGTFALFCLGIAGLIAGRRRAY